MPEWHLLCSVLCGVDGTHREPMCAAPYIHLRKQLHYICHSRVFGLLRLALFLERLGDQVALLLLNIQHALFNSALHDKTPNLRLTSLTKTVYSINSLVFNRWCPPYERVQVSTNPPWQLKYGKRENDLQLSDKITVSAETRLSPTLQTARLASMMRVSESLSRASIA